MKIIIIFFNGSAKNCGIDLVGRSRFRFGCHHRASSGRNQHTHEHGHGHGRTDRQPKTNQHTQTVIIEKWNKKQRTNERMRKKIKKFQIWNLEIFFQSVSIPLPISNTILNCPTIKIYFFISKKKEFLFDSSKWQLWKNDWIHSITGPIRPLK